MNTKHAEETNSPTNFHRLSNPLNYVSESEFETKIFDKSTGGIGCKDVFVVVEDPNAQRFVNDVSGKIMKFTSVMRFFSNSCYVN